MNIILLGACVLIACFGIFTALLGSGKPKLFGALFGIILGSGLAVFVCKTLGLSLTSMPVAIAMGGASIVLLALAIWKEAASLLIISVCGGLYIGGGLVYGVMSLFSIQMDWIIASLAAAILALVFAAVCLIRPSNGILISTSMAGGALVSISGSVILYMILTITTSAGFIGDLLALYKALSANTILLIWLFGLLLGGGAILLQSLLMRTVEEVDDDSWENWEPEGYEEEEPAPVVKRGPRRKKKQLVEPYDWDEPEDTFDEQDETDAFTSQAPAEEAYYEEPAEEPETFESEEPVPAPEEEERIRTVIPPTVTAHTSDDTKVFRKVTLPDTAQQAPAQPLQEQSESVPREAPQASSGSRLQRPSFPPRSSRRK